MRDLDYPKSRQTLLQQAKKELRIAEQMCSHWDIESYPDISVIGEIPDCCIRYLQANQDYKKAKRAVERQERVNQKKISLPALANVLAALESKKNLALAERFVSVKLNEITDARISYEIDFYNGLTDIIVTVMQNEKEMCSRKRTFPVAIVFYPNTGIIEATMAAIRYINELLEDYTE